MKKVVNYIVPLFLFLSIFVTNLPAVELFVATNGSDENPGTQEKPFATVQKARDTIREKNSPPRPSWIVHIAPGVYELDAPIVFDAQDSQQHWKSSITYRGATGEEKTIFSGGKQIKDWKEIESGPWKGVWVAQIPKTNDKCDYFEQLFVNDNRAVRARHPNFDNGKPKFLNPQAVEQLVPITREAMVEQYTPQSLTGKPGELSPLFKDVAQEEFKYAQLIVHHHWDTSRRIPLRFDAETETIRVQGHPMKSWNPWRNTSQYYVENLRTAFDAPGEWFYEGTTGKVYYRPLPGETIAETKIFYAKPGVNRLLDIRGAKGPNGAVKNLRFENLHFTYSDTPRDTAVMQRASLPLEITGDLSEPGPSQFEPEQAAFYTGAAIELSHAEGIKFTNCSFSHLGEYAVRMQLSDNCVLRGCKLRDLGAGGIRIGHDSSGNTVTYCTIEKAGQFHASAVGVWIGNFSNDNKIINNDISDLYYTGVSVGWTWGYNGNSFRNIIEYNRIHNIGQRAMADMGGVYTLGTAHGTRVCNNVIFDVSSYAYGGWGLYPDEGTEGIVMENNLVYDTTDGSFHQHYGKNNTIRNNILAFSRPHQVAITRVENHLSITFENNIIVWDQGSAIGYQTDQARTDFGSNIWWNYAGDVDFKGKTHQQWHEMGKDVGGVIADPLFFDVENRDFRLKEESPAIKAGFKPFDFTKAGVRNLGPQPPPSRG